MHAQCNKAPTEKTAHHAVADHIFRIKRQLCCGGIVSREHEPATQNALAVQHPNRGMRKNKLPIHSRFNPPRHCLVVAEQKRHQM